MPENTNFECRQMIDFFYDLYHKNNMLNQSMYEKYNVKRGLRNADGTGVVAGITAIGEVHGYIVDEGEKVPVEGKLSYRGVNVADLVDRVEKSNNRFGFEEACYLLLFGELPEAEELKEFSNIIGGFRYLPENFNEDMIMKAPSKDIMNKLSRCVLSSYSYDYNPDEISLKNMLRQSLSLISKMPVFAAYAYQAKRYYFDGSSLYVHQPQSELSTAENFLYMIRPDNKYTELEAKVLDMMLILHAEHGGGNNSTFTTRVMSSTGTDTYSAIAAAVGSLKGPKHGGANVMVEYMMNEIKEAVTDWNNHDEIDAYLTKIIKKEAFDKTGLVYGMGHAVYTLSDPRAVLLKEHARALAIEKGREKEFALYDYIESAVPRLLKEVKGFERPICANIDFYSGLVYTMLDIPYELFTPMFAIARVVGWCAHRIEEIEFANKIIRPAYKSVKVKHNNPDESNR